MSAPIAVQNLEYELKYFPATAPVPELEDTIRLLYGLLGRGIPAKVMINFKGALRTPGTAKFRLGNSSAISFDVANNAEIICNQMQNLHFVHFKISGTNQKRQKTTALHCVTHE